MPLTHLRSKYQTQAPRYTSYPSANVFAAIPPEQAWAAWSTATAERSLYVHVPFCSQRCWFCACQVEVSNNRARIDRYTDWLLADLEWRLSMFTTPRAFVQVAFGGGTPTSLGMVGLARVMARVRSLMDTNAECAIELDPRATHLSDAEMLLRMGFNRFSLGVQDLDPAVLHSVHREQAATKVADLVLALRTHGAKSINIDLISGLPHQTEQSMTTTAQAVLAMEPDRIAVYGYAHVPQLKPQQQLLARAGLPKDRSALFDAAARVLLDAGYQAVGFDHFAKPHDELARAATGESLHRNFMGYTTRPGLDLIGIGASAISDVNGVYTQNAKSSEAYGAAIEAGRDPLERGHSLSVDDQLRRQLILDLSCNLRTSSARLGVSIPLEQLFANEYLALAPLAQDGLLTLTPDSVELTELGRHFVRNVCAVFDQYLLPHGAQRVHSLVH